MRIITIFLLTTILLIPISLSAQTNQAGKKISPDLFGLFFEDINYSADGGLYAELVQNRSFEYNPAERREWHPLSYWEYITPGFSYGRISVETSSPIHANNPHYITLDIEHVGKEAQYTGISGVGIKNSGFDGMVIRTGEEYNLSLFAKLFTNNPITLIVSLQNRKGEELATNTITISSGDWQNYTASLTAAAGYDSASLVILAQTGGKMALDVISLFPEKTFNNRPNGLRADLAQVLADMKPGFIRFPGGCLVHGDGLGNMYRWKNTIGPVEQRKEQRNLWGYHQTTGLGYFEYFQFCEDIGAKPLPVLPAAVSCQNSGGTWRIGGTGQRALPMNEMQDYIQEVLDLIEWANGPTTSTWGAKRAAAGHPAPFNLEFIGIGNEDKMTPEFQERFKMIYKAVNEKHPEITVIGSSGPFHSGDDFNTGWKLANDLKIPVVDEHYYTSPDWFIGNQMRYDTYDRNSSHVYLGEYASWGNKMINAIGEAAFMTALERNGDVVRMASYAPLLAKKNFTQWTTDMIFFDNVTICQTPNYYVQKLFSVNQGDLYFDKVIIKDPKDTALAASCVQDSKTGDIILKLVNAGQEDKVMKINLGRFGKIMPDAEQTVLSGEADAENTIENPRHVVPVETTVKVSQTFDYAAPEMSLTVIRIKTRIFPQNPIIYADVPDMAMIRVGDTYYMSSTTMHMSPGVPIMKSKDLVNWQIVNYAYDILDDVDSLNLNNGKSSYGRGSWASCIRYHNDTYYVSTFTATTGKTYIYSTKDIEKGPWTKISFAPSYHDNTLFFDDDGRTYLIYGAGRLKIVEMDEDLSGVKPGTDRVLIENASLPAGTNIMLGAEGSQLFKVNGKYYLFNITWPRGGMRTVIVHRADKITGPYEGRLVLQDLGVAQGGIIDTPEGNWYAYLFRDFGSVGRIPYLVPVKWEDGWPVLGINGKVPEKLDLPVSKGLIPGIVASDEFSRTKKEHALPLVWQWNHNPDNKLWSVSQRKGYLRLSTARIDTSFEMARNTLTQRTFGPVCSGSILLEISGMKDGDFAGLCLLQKKYGQVGVRMENGKPFIVMVNADSRRPIEIQRVPLTQKTVFLKAECDFRNRADLGYFFYSLDGKNWTPIGNHLKMEYSLMEHFMGYRFGLFNYATRQPGGYADFDFFHINSEISLKN